MTRPLTAKQRQQVKDAVKRQLAGMTPENVQKLARRVKRAKPAKRPKR